MGATAALSLQAASVIGGASSAFQSAGAARRQGAYSAAIDTQNAGLADAQARDAVARGTIAEDRQRQQTAGLAGSQRATAAANGIDVGSGSAADITSDTARMGELDALTIRNNAAREAYGYQVSAANDRAAAINAQQAGNNQAGADRAGGYSALLTGAGRLSQQWMANPPTFGPVRNWWARGMAQPGNPARMASGQPDDGQNP